MNPLRSRRTPPRPPSSTLNSSNKATEEVDGKIYDLEFPIGDPSFRLFGDSYTACQVMATLSMRTSSDATEPAWTCAR